MIYLPNKAEVLHQASDSYRHRDPYYLEWLLSTDPTRTSPASELVDLLLSHFLDLKRKTICSPNSMTWRTKSRRTTALVSVSAILNIRHFMLCCEFHF